MNRISTSLLLLLALGLSVVSTTACSDDEDGQNEPAAQTSELTDAEKKAAETQENPGPSPTATVTELSGPLPDPWDHTITKACDTCGPLPDPWAHASTSGGTPTSTGTSTDATGHK